MKVERKNRPPSCSCIAQPRTFNFQPSTFNQWFLCLLVGLVLVAGCCTSRETVVFGRPFDFDRDAFSYTNELTWSYHYDPQGRWVGEAREPEADYALHCFPMVRSARQFYYHAQFAPGQARLEPEDYRRLISQVLGKSARTPSPDDRRVLIPGYGDLRSFSRDYEQALKAESGGAWESYFQRGHWRMVFPFSRKSQLSTANQILVDLGRNRPPIVHVVTFPALTINHAVLVYDSVRDGQKIRFQVYDPNAPAEPVEMLFDRETRTFSLPQSAYFPGGPIDVYQIYHRWNY